MIGAFLLFENFEKNCYNIDIWITDPQRTYSEYFNDTNNAGY
jgi:hypothetical protein